MKRVVVVLMALVGWSCSLAWGDLDYHDFTDTQGRTIRARIVSYDAKKNTVELKTEDNRSAGVPLVALSEADQEYIRSWDKLKDFMDERHFKIDSKKKVSDNDEESWQETGNFANQSLDVENIGYEILFENKTDTTFKDITVEYRIFYEQEESDFGPNIRQEGIYCDSMNIKRLGAKSKRRLLTKAVLVYKATLNADWQYVSGRQNVQKGWVDGVWVRASVSLPNGEKVMREYCTPDSLARSRRWPTESVNVGMNK